MPGGNGRPGTRSRAREFVSLRKEAVLHSLLPD